MTDVPTLRARYACLADYQLTLGQLVKGEEKYVEEEMRKDRRGVEVTWTPATRTATGGHLPPVMATIKTSLPVKTGDLVRLTHPASMWEEDVKVVKVNGSYDGVTVTLSIPGNKTVRIGGITTNFQVSRVYNPTVRDRKLAALRNLPNVQPFLLDILVLGKVDQVPQTGLVIPGNLQVPKMPVPNKPQEHAIKRVLKTKFGLVQGPPGTGKTVMAATIVYHEDKLSSAQKLGKKVLVVAPSNTATDQLAKQLTAVGIPCVCAREPVVFH